MARRLLRWPLVPPISSVPRHPYRDSAIFHGALAALIVVVSWVSGSDVGKAVAIACAYFVAATLWSWWRFHERARRLDATKEEQ